MTNKNQSKNQRMTVTEEEAIKVRLSKALYNIPDDGLEALVRHLIFNHLDTEKQLIEARDLMNRYLPETKS